MATSPSSPVSGPAATMPNPSVPPPPKRRSGAAIAAAAVVVVVVIVLVALLVAGVLPGLHSSSSSTPSGSETYSQAAGAANALAGTTTGGPWTLSAVEGWALTSPYTTHLATGCTITQGSGALTIPSSTGNYSSGVLSDWGFVYANAGFTSELGIVVQNGAASVVGVATAAGNCTVSSQVLGTLGNQAVDSSRAAAAAYSESPVLSYVGNHSTSNASFILANAGGSTGALWLVTYTTCNVVNLSATVPATGATVAADFYASNGTLKGSVRSSPSSTSCGPPVPPPPKKPIGTALALGNPASGTCTASEVTAKTCATAGDETYSLTIEQSTVNLSSVEFEVDTPSGGVFANTLAGSFAVESITGTEVAGYTVPAGVGLEMTALWSSYGSSYTASTPLTSEMTLVVDTGIASSSWAFGAGDYVVGLGVGAYNGTTAHVTLP